MSQVEANERVASEAGVQVNGCAVSELDVQAAQRMIDFVSECPSMFHTVAALRQRLDAAGFTYVPEGQRWNVERGGTYYTVRNNSSLIAFRVGGKLDSYHFQLTAAHSDSPTYKVKAVPELAGPAQYLRLNVEAYGGVMDHTWFDKPLSVAGRVLVREGNRLVSRLYAPDNDLLIIPRVPIHLDHQANAGFTPNRAVDLCPLFSAGALKRGAFDAMVAEDLGVAVENVVARDLFLVNRQQPRVWGRANEFVSAPRLDDLGCVFISLEAFLAASNPHDVSVFCCFDNEEVGSNTKQGAMSTFLRDTLERLNGALGFAVEDLRCALAKSMLVSCDNAHAVHPNHPERYDEYNRVQLNRGLVVKEAANQKYCTDAFSRAVFCALCADAGVPLQAYANRSDMPGGSTLGNLSNMQVSMHGVDVGLPQLAMHSSYETAGVADVRLGTRALQAFFEADVRIDGADAAVLA